MRYPITKKQFIEWLRSRPRKKAGALLCCPIVKAVIEITKKPLPEGAYPTDALENQWPFRCARIIDFIRIKGSCCPWSSLTRKQVFDALKKAGEIKSQS